MKFVVLLAVIIAVLWLGRALRRRVGNDRPAKPPSGTQEAMVACPQCGVHLPRSEALPGRGGLFCCEAHRSAYEHAQPPGR